MSDSLWNSLDKPPDIPLEVPAVEEATEATFEPLPEFDSTIERVSEPEPAAEQPFQLFGADLFGSAITQDVSGALRQKFDFPPFTVLNAREGQWQDRKRAWLSIGIKSELGRGENLQPLAAEDLGSDLNNYRNMRANAGKAYDNSGSPGELSAELKRRDASPGGSPRPAMDYSNRERGDGAGRPITSRAEMMAGMTEEQRRSMKAAEPGGGGGPNSGYFGHGAKMKARPPHGPSVTQNPDGTLNYKPSNAPTRSGTSGSNVAMDLAGGFDNSSAGTSGTSVFDPVLTELCYRWFCPPGGMILDPFAGGSVRGIVAGLLGYRYHGIDLRPEQIAANEAQREQIAPKSDIHWVTGDSNLELPNAPMADFIFSCPPYGDLERYSDDPRDISTMTWEQFVGIYRSIIRKSVERLKPNRFAVFVVGEYRDPKTGCYRGFVPLTCASFMSSGAALYNEAILITAVGSLPIRVTKQFETTRKLGKTHQNIIVCLKGDAREAAAAIAAGVTAGAVDSQPAPLTPPAMPPRIEVAAANLVPIRAGHVPLIQVLGAAAASPMLLGQNNSTWVPKEPPSLDGINELEFDTETDGLKWWAGERPIGCSIRRPDGYKQYLPWGHRPGGNLDEAVCKEWARRELRNKRLTGVNIRFDVHMMREWGIDLEEQGCTVSDVQHYAALLDDHRKRFSMDELSKHYLGKEKVGKTLDATRMADYHAGDVAPRAEGDVQLTAELREAMWPLLDKEDLQRVRALEDEVIFPVCEMEKNGSPLDMELLEQFSRECMARHDALMIEIQQEAGFVFDHSSSGWQRLFEKYGLPMTYLDENKPTFAEDVLDEQTHPIIKKAQFAGQLSSLNSKTFAAYKRIVDGDLLRYEINQLKGDEGGTVSGRFSIGYVQQVPNHDNHSAVFGEDYFPRRLFVPRSGDYLAADAAQIEYRIFASYAANPRVLAAYEQDPDISFHKMTWEMIKPYKPDMHYTHQKATNFMKLYAGGLVKLGIMLGDISKRQGEEIRASKTQNSDLRLARAREIERIYAQQLPEVEALTKQASHLAMTKCDKWCRRSDRLHRDFPHRGFVKTMLGRRSRFPDGWKTYRGLNRVISGSAADVNKQKLVELHKERKVTGFVLRITAHDEACGDSPDQRCAEMVREILNRQSFPNLKVPIRWSVNTGSSWAACK